MQGIYVIIAGMLMILIGFFLIFLANSNASKYNEMHGMHTSDSRPDYPGVPPETAQHEPSVSKTEIKGGGIIMLGPIPIIIGSDSSTAKTIVILTIVLMVLYLIIFM